MMEKLEALGNQLSTQGIINAAAFATLTGALAGTLAIGGVTGALADGGIALLGFLAIVAIAAIGYAVYKHRGEIKEGAIDAGKAIKSFMKNLIDQLPTIQARENNFTKLKSDSLEQHRKSTGEEQIKLNNKIEIITMLQDEGRRSAIKELLKDGTIQNFSEDEMTRFVEKGTSTHENDMEALNELMEKFQPTIMAIGNNNIEEVKEKVNEKVQGKESPSGEMDVSNAEQVGTTERQPGSS